MPGNVKVKVIAARNLPIMDRSTFLADAFVELYIGNITFKTEVYRRSLNPVWNSDWFCFELDDQALQEEALLLKVMDHDTYSAHDTIGRVYFDLNPLLSRGQTRCLNGWFPIYDTMHGIRGEINLAIRVDVFLDANLYRQSSLGVHFFHSCSIPEGYSVDSLIGFVQELVMNDDPEHQWMEKIRTSRASNEARQRLFSRLSGQLQRKIGLKVLNLGGNSVIGYQLHFDLEGETGVVVRGIGTAVRLRKCSIARSSVVTFAEHPSKAPQPTGECISEGVTEANEPPSHPGGGGELLYRSVHSTSSRGLALSEPLQWGEFPFLTISQPPPGMIFRFGSIVSAKSVKLMGTNTPAGLQFRDAWWTELRTEVTAQMCSIGCNAVIGYREECAAIYEDVCILSNYGTAVVLDPHFFTSHQLDHRAPVTSAGGETLGAKQMGTMEVASIDRSPAVHVPTRQEATGCHDKQSPRETTSSGCPSEPEDRGFAGLEGGLSSKPVVSELPATRTLGPECSLLHLPEHHHHHHHREHCAAASGSLGVSPLPPGVCPPSLCGVCRAASVPDLLLASVDVPRELKTVGRPALIQARISRSKKDVKGEVAANELSELLPFVEYELHYRLLQKLRLRGMNAVFGLRLRITVGDFMLAAVATGTGVFALALPAPPPPKVFHDSKAPVTLEDRLFRSRLQLKLNEFLHRSRQVFGLDVIHEGPTDGAPCGNLLAGASPSVRPEQLTGPEIGTGQSLANSSTARETVFLETREPDPEELAVLLRDPLQPMGLLLTTTETVPLATDRQGNTRDPPLSTVDVHQRGQSVATWLPGHSFVRLHEAELSETDSFFEVSSSTATTSASNTANITPSGDLSHLLPAGSRVTCSGATTPASAGPPVWSTFDKVTSAVQPGLGSSGGSPQSDGPSTADIDRGHTTNTTTGASSSSSSSSGCLSHIMNEVNQLTWLRLRHMLPCALTALDYRLTITDDQHVQVVTTGMVLVPSVAKALDGAVELHPLVSNEEGKLAQQFHPPGVSRSSPKDESQLEERGASPVARTPVDRYKVSPPGDSLPGACCCLLTPLSRVPGSEVEAYLGNLDFFFVRETTELRELGGICSFLHASLSEVQAVVSAHTTSLGGNALLSYHLSEVVLLRPSARNQAQCLFNVCGDMVRLCPQPARG